MDDAVAKMESLFTQLAGRDKRVQSVTTFQLDPLVRLQSTLESAESADRLAQIGAEIIKSGLAAKSTLENSDGLVDSNKEWRIAKLAFDDRQQLVLICENQLALAAVIDADIESHAQSDESQTSQDGLEVSQAELKVANDKLEMIAVQNEADNVQDESKN